MEPVYLTCLSYLRKYLDIHRQKDTQKTIYTDKSVIKQKSKTANNPLSDQKSRSVRVITCENHKPGKPIDWYQGKEIFSTSSRLSSGKPADW